ncbi:hypothetical protein [Pseudomonas mandelii]|uniref:hypothetical protein n=1 Tax=Pseudomonas mandelii TaxID=75612 RepID=UPI003C73F91F
MQTTSRSQASSTTAVTLRQLAALCQLDHTSVGRPEQELPEAVPLRTGKPGHPPLCIPLEALIEWALGRTEGLSDIECRMRLAMMNERKRKPAKAPGAGGTFRIIKNAQGELVMVSHDGDGATPEEFEIYCKESNAHRAACNNQHAARRAGVTL